MEIIFNDLHDLCVAAFKDDSKQKEFDAALADEHQKIKKIFDSLENGSEDCFFQKDAPSEAGKSLIRIWTRSTRKDIPVQATVWLCRDNEKTVMALSHYDVMSVEDMYRDADPSDGCVYGVKTEEISGSYPPGIEYMETVKE